MKVNNQLPEGFIRVEDVDFDRKTGYYIFHTYDGKIIKIRYAMTDTLLLYVDPQAKKLRYFDKEGVLKDMDPSMKKSCTVEYTDKISNLEKNGKVKYNVKGSDTVILEEMSFGDDLTKKITLFRRRNINVKTEIDYYVKTENL